MNNALFTTRERTLSGTGIGKRAVRGLTATLAAVALMGMGSTAKADTISYFNFNNLSSNTSPTFPIAADAGTGSITTNFGNVAAGPATTNPAPGSANVTTFAGTTTNAQQVNGVTSPAGRTLALLGGTNNANNGGVLTIGGVNTTGFSGISVSFATQKSGTGFSNNQFSYSLDGVNFVDFGAAYNPVTDSYGIQTFNLSGISGLENNTSAAFRITFTGATSASGNNRIDNLYIQGTNATTATPEPETWAMMGLGIFALGVFQIRRKRSPQLVALPSNMAF